MVYPLGPLPQTSQFGPILLAIKAKLLTDVLPNGDIVISKNVPATPAFLAGTQGIRIMCGGIRTTDNPGAGRYFKVVQRVVTVEVHTRITLDIAGEGEIVMTDPLFGHLYLEEAVVESLHERNLVGVGGVNLLTEPMKLQLENPDTRPVGTFSESEGFTSMSPPADDIISSQLFFLLTYGFAFKATV